MLVTSIACAGCQLGKQQHPQLTSTAVSKTSEKNAKLAGAEKSSPSNIRLANYQQGSEQPVELVAPVFENDLEFEDASEPNPVANDGDISSNMDSVASNGDADTQLEAVDRDGQADAQPKATDDGETGDGDTDDQMESTDGESAEAESADGQDRLPVPPEDRTTDIAVSLQAVLESVVECYPEIDIAIGELEAANGKVLASWGDFDTVFAAHSISQPLGFYQTYRNGVGLSRPLYGGGEVYGTYRIGDGNFEPWFGERETNEAGEFKAGFSLPLLKDRDIDLRRANVRSERLRRNQLEANIEARLLMFERFATQAYWDWVASGQAVSVQRQLLKLAEQRVAQISARMEEGDLAAIAEIDNNRFIAKRRNSLIKARRGLEKAALKLSMFYRDGACEPIVVDQILTPVQFPLATQMMDGRIAQDIDVALASRPELIELAAARHEACVQLQYANNLLLPKLDLKGFAGQDIGGETSSTGDKTPFELQLGVFAEVPIQRREGAGKVQAARGKIAQIDAKRQLVSDKIRLKILDAASAVNNAAEQIEQSKENVRLTQESLRLGRLAFEEGDIDLLALNIYESDVADAQLQLLDAEFKYFASLAIYETMVRNQAFVTAPVAAQ